MPGRNIYKEYVSDSYYHIYNRGVNKQLIFKTKQDYVFYLSLLKRYLGDKTQLNKNGVNHPNYSNDADLLTFCLMGNHFHLLVYQKEDPAVITKLMRSVTSSYSMYFNKTHNRVGPLFQQRYRAVRLTDDSQLLHITRYIHLNPANFNQYEWSSYPYYIGNKQASWVKPGRILGLFSGDYKDFVESYKPKHDELEEIKAFLANS
jgi:REP element-mobilizing transposase RayT